MPFDASTAQLVSSQQSNQSQSNGFDPSTAQLVSSPSDSQDKPEGFADIDNPSPQNQPQAQSQNKGNLQDQVYANLAQFGKNEAASLPFAGRLAQLGGLMSGKPMTPDDMNEMYKNVGNPNGVIQNVSAMGGQLVPQMLMMTPFLKGANLIGGLASDAIKNAIPGIGGKIAAGVVNSPMVRGAIGLGGYSGTKSALTGGNGQQIRDDTVQGITQGLIYGGLMKMGATFMPKELFGKYAETIGSAAGGAIAGAVTSSGGNNAKASAILMGGLAALTPEERMDFHKFIANNVTPEQFAKYMRSGLQLEPDDIKTIQDNGMSEIQRVGNMIIPNKNPITGNTDSLGPVQIAQQFYQAAKQGIKQKISQQFQDAIKNNTGNNPTDINDFVGGLKKQVDNYADPTSPIVRRFNTTYNALQGFNPTTTETEIPGTKEQPNSAAPNPRQININELPKNIQAQVRQQLGNTGDITNLNLNALHELKMNLSDAISDHAWKTGEFDPNERFAYTLQKQIGDYIGKNNEAYKSASREYSRMKSVSDDINSLNTNNLGKDWSELAPANKIDLMNKLDGIGSYLKEKGFGEYDPKGLLQKYHAYNAISNPDTTSFRNNAPLKIAFQNTSGWMGAMLGLPFGLHGAAFGGGLGYLTALHYMRPKSYIPLLEEMTKTAIPKSMTSVQAEKLIKNLISSK